MFEMEKEVTKTPDTEFEMVFTEVLLLLAAAYPGVVEFTDETKAAYNHIFNRTIVKGLNKVGWDKWHEIIPEVGVTGRAYATRQTRKFAGYLKLQSVPPSEVTGADLEWALQETTIKTQEAMARLNPEIRQRLDALPKPQSEMTAEEKEEHIMPMFPFCPI